MYICRNIYIKSLMKNLVVFFVLFLMSFVGFSQVDTNEISFKNLSPLFGEYCSDDSDLNKVFFIPLSIDTFGIRIFNETINYTFSKGEYKAYLLDYKTDRKYIRDIWVEVVDGDNESIIVQFCTLNDVFKTGILFDEYKTIFDFIKTNNI